ncbi:MAG: hypothetical protein HYS56_01825, partial [Candidatus Omnitrophica bacterium]|nr:hypothetical protein [Candidatus Omnitrophota bacterium]
FLPAAIRESDPNALVSSDFLDARECDEMDAFVWRLTQRWCQSLTDLGRMAEYDLQIYLFRRLRNLDILSRLISRCHPRILYCCDNMGDLWPVVEFLGRMLNLQTVRRRLKGDKPPLWEGKPGFKEWLTGKATALLDLLAVWACRKSVQDRAAVLADDKLWDSLNGSKTGVSFIPCIFGSGLRRRLEFLRKGTPYFSLQPKIHWRLLPLDCFSSLHPLWRRFDGDETLKKQFSFRGICFYPMIRPELKKIFLRDFPRITANRRRVEKIAEQLHPAVVLLRNEDKELEKTCIIGFKPTATQSIVLQHGIIAIPILREKLLCDINAVWGPAGIRYFTERGFSSEKCVVTGNPEYDLLVEPKSFDRREDICRALKLDPSRPLLVFASQRPHSFSSAKSNDDQQKLIVVLLNAMEALKEIQCVIKVHPFDDERPIRRLIAAAPRLEDRIRVIQKTELFPLLASCDIVMVHNSTVGLSAMVFSKPVIVMNLTGREDTVPYVSEGAAMGVYEPTGLAPAVKKLLQEGEVRYSMLEKQKELIADQAFKIDGKARKRLLELLSSVRPPC